MWKKTKRMLIPSICLLFASGISVAGDGRLELNQAAIDLAGGFPYTIGQSGSYVLTGDLTVPAATDGLVVTADDVTIDLNGFSIGGPFDCAPGSCTTGTNDGVSTSGSPVRVTVRNGRVFGFDRYCVVLSSQARVEDLRVHDCRFGIVAGENGIVMRNQVSDIGDTGIQGANSSVFAHNTVVDADLRGLGRPALQGGSATAGNVCDDGTCSRIPRRRYYLTSATFDGVSALSACATGFRLASLWDIFDPTLLRYDESIAGAEPGALYAMPTIGGWADVSVGSNCSNWTQTAGTGRLVEPPNSTPGTYDHVWTTTALSCTLPVRVWCVEP